MVQVMEVMNVMALIAAGLLTLPVSKVLVEYLLRHLTSWAIESIIHARYACKSWQKGKLVPKWRQRTILELALRAPSAFNTQPYNLIIVESDEDKEKLAREMHGPNPEHVRSSSFSVVLAADPEPLPRVPADAPSFAAQALEHVSLPQQSTPEAWAVKNVMILASFLIAATAHGLQTNPMEGLKSQKAVKEALGIPERYDVPLVVSVGYADKARPEKSGRRPVEEMCFRGHFGRPF